MSPIFFFFFTSYHIIIFIVIVLLEILLDKAQEFQDAGKTFSEYAKELIQSHDSLAIRRINDAIMKVERNILLKIENR